MTKSAQELVGRHGGEIVILGKQVHKTPHATVFTPATPAPGHRLSSLSRQVQARRSRLPFFIRIHATPRHVARPRRPAWPAMSRQSKII